MDITAEADDRHLRVDSVTGVPLDLAIAGPGGRSFAFIIDFHIRALGAVAWAFGFSLWVRQYTDEGLEPPGWLLLVAFLPPVIIYFLYHPVLELAMAGRTPGKRMAGIRIVTAEGMVPGTGAIVLRNLFRFVDGMPAFYIAGLVTTILTRRHQRIGDLAAGTVLIYDEEGKAENLGDLAKAGATRGLTTGAAELVQDLIDRWPTLDPEDRLALARRLLARLDPEGADARSATLNDGNALAALRATLGGIL
jgi:uncharacterized RDD family membrane protein YckC